MQQSSEQASWFLQIGSDLVLYYLLASLVILRILWSMGERSREEQNLFSFLLLFLAFVNFAGVIPTLGGRYMSIFFLFGTLYLFQYYSALRENNLSLLTLAGLFPMLLYMAISFRLGSLSMSVWLFAPLLGSPLVAPDLTVYDLLFG